MSELWNLVILPVVAPIYWVLFRIQRRLTKVETKLDMLCPTNCEKGEEK